MKKLIFIILTVLMLPVIYQSTPTEILKLKTFDAFIKKQQPSGNFVILNITEQDVENEGGYPFPRKRLGDINNSLMEKGALGVGWVISFPQADRMNGDQFFSESLKNSNSVIAMFQDGKGSYPKTTGTVIKGDNVGGILSTGVKQNIQPLSEGALQGLAIAPTEIDQLVRRIPLLVRTPDGWIASFGTQVLKALTSTRTYIIKTNDNGIEEVAIKGIPPVKTDSMGRKWISWIDTPETTLAEMNVENKYVFVGITANGVMPQIATPTGLLEPHKIQAALAESILIQDSPYIPDWALAAEILIIFTTIILSWIFIIVFGISSGILFTSILFLLTAFGGYYLIQQGILIDVSWSLISQFITASIAFYLRFREQFKLRLQIKKQFEHYLDPRQVKRLQKNPELLKLGGEKREATFLFTDVRGFTSMSELLPPEKVTYIMNKALTAQQSAVQKHGGMVDKYIGDAMMAIFNAPLDLLDHPKIAIDCSLDIIRNMKSLNIELQKEDLPPVAIGIGINTGIAVIGNMGSESRFDYTAIGDAVNTAARLESATKDRNVNLLIGKSTTKASGYKLKKLKSIKVKGKTKALEIYTYE